PSHLAKKVKPEEIASPEKKAGTPANANEILKKTKEISETRKGDIKDLTPKKELQVLKDLYEVNPKGTNKFALWGFILSLTSIIIFWGLTPLVLLIGLPFAT